MTTDPDIIDWSTPRDITERAEQVMHDFAKDAAENGHIRGWNRMAKALADAGLLRDSDQQRNERMAADAKVYADLEDARAERDKAIAERNMAVGRVDEMRQRLAQARSQRDEALGKLDEVRKAADVIGQRADEKPHADSYEEGIRDAYDAAELLVRKALDDQDLSQYLRIGRNNT